MGHKMSTKGFVIPSIMLQGIPQTVTLDQCVSDNDWHFRSLSIYLQYLSAFIFSLLFNISSWSLPSVFAFFNLLFSSSLRRKFLSWKLWNFLTKLISWFRRSFSPSGKLLVHTLLWKKKKQYQIILTSIHSHSFQVTDNLFFSLSSNFDMAYSSNVRQNLLRHVVSKHDEVKLRGKHYIKPQKHLPLCPDCDELWILTKLTKLYLFFIFHILTLLLLQVISM